MRRSGPFERCFVARPPLANPSPRTSFTHYCSRPQVPSIDNFRTIPSFRHYCNHVQERSGEVSELLTRLGVESVDDVYTLPAHHIRSVRPTMLKTTFYNDLRRSYPNVEWEPWRFEDAELSRGWRWSDLESVVMPRRWLHWAAEKLNVARKDHFYSISYDVLCGLPGGRALIRRFNDSPALMIMSLIGEVYTLRPWAFHNTSRGFWQSLENQRAYADWLGERLHVERYRDWHAVQTSLAETNYGHRILAIYGNSVSALLVSVYFEVSWRPWEFARPPVNIWNSNESVDDSFATSTAFSLHIYTFNDWYRISHDQIRTIGGRALLKAAGGSLAHVLRRLVPQWPHWDDEQLRSKAKRSMQRWLRVQLLSLLPPGEQVLEDVAPDWLRFQKSGAKMELDLYVPRLRLAFEYQGAHHYDDIPFFGFVHQYRARDEAKAQACEAANVTLIEVCHTYLIMISCEML